MSKPGKPGVTDKFGVAIIANTNIGESLRIYTNGCAKHDVVLGKCTPRLGEWGGGGCQEAGVSE